MGRCNECVSRCLPASEFTAVHLTHPIARNFREKPFDEHLRDVVAMVAYVLGMSRQERQSERLDLWKLDFFFIRRAHRKLAGRIDMMDRGTRWPARPLVLMRECYARSPRTFNTTVRLSRKLALSEKYGILPSDPADPHIYPLTNLNIEQWLTLFEDLLLRLKGALFGGHGKLHEIREVPTVDATNKIFVYLAFRFVQDTRWTWYGCMPLSNRPSPTE